MNIRTLLFIPLLVCLFILCGFRWFNPPQTTKISLDFTSKILEKGKVLTVKGELYYKFNGGVMTTHLTSPFENITIINNFGDTKIYDPLENTVIQYNSRYNTSETSYFNHFFSKTYSDMGFSKLGYKMISSKIDEGDVVTIWEPKEGIQTPIRKIELVHEKTLPIYLCFFASNKKPLGKIFFSNYQKVAEYLIPFKITEFSYNEKGDSTVTKKEYSNPKTNESVNPKYADFVVPFNAKVVNEKAK